MMMLSYYFISTLLLSFIYPSTMSLSLLTLFTCYFNIYLTILPVNFIRWLAERNNIADVTAKADSQMVVSELLGLAVGVSLIHFWHDPQHLFLIFALTAPVHFACTVMRLKAIRFGMLSASRTMELFTIYVRHHIRHTVIDNPSIPDTIVHPSTVIINHQSPNPSTVSMNISTGTSTSNINPGAATSTASAAATPTLRLPSPLDCHATDKWFGEWFYPREWQKHLGLCEVKMGALASEAFESENELMEALNVFSDELYLLNYRTDTNSIYICFEEG